MTLTIFIPIPFDLIWHWIADVAFCQGPCGTTPWYGWVFITGFLVMLIYALMGATKSLGKSLDPQDDEREQLIQREIEEHEFIKREYMKKLEGGYKPRMIVDNQLKLAI